MAQTQPFRQLNVQLLSIEMVNVQDYDELLTSCHFIFSPPLDIGFLLLGPSSRPA